jgi:hypothetical protein
MMATVKETKLPQSEIEITPEMIRAGVAAYLAHDGFFDSDEVGVRRIFEAMIFACPSAPYDDPRVVALRPETCFADRDLNKPNSTEPATLR